MAKGTTYKVLGTEKDIKKVPDHRGRLRYGIDVELTFADGRVKVYTHRADRKKDVIAAMQPGGSLERDARAAELDENNRLSFCLSTGYNAAGVFGFHPACEVVR